MYEHIWYRIFVVLASSYFCGCTYILYDDKRKFGTRAYKGWHEDKELFIKVSALMGACIGGTLSLLAIAFYFFKIPWLLVYYGAALYCFFVIDFHPTKHR